MLKGKVKGDKMVIPKSRQSCKLWIAKQILAGKGLLEWHITFAGKEIKGNETAYILALRALARKAPDLFDRPAKPSLEMSN